MPKNFKGPLPRGPKVSEDVIAGAAVRSQARAIEAMLNATAPGGPEQFKLQALAEPALRDADGIFTAAKVDRGPIEAEFRELASQFANVDGPARAALIEGFEARWGEALARVQAIAGKPTMAVAPPQAAEALKQNTSLLDQEIDTFFVHRSGGNASEGGDFRLPIQSVAVAGSDRAGVALGAEVLLPGGLTDLGIRATVRFDTRIAASALVIAGYASAGVTVRVHARTTSMDGSWYRDFSPRSDGEPFHIGGLVHATYVPVAGTGSYLALPHEDRTMRALQPVPEPLMLTVWVVIESWATSGGLAGSIVDAVAGQLVKLRIYGG